MAHANQCTGGSIGIILYAEPGLSSIRHTKSVTCFTTRYDIMKLATYIQWLEEHSADIRRATASIATREFGSSTSSGRPITTMVSENIDLQTRPTGSNSLLRSLRSNGAKVGTYVPERMNAAKEINQSITAPQGVSRWDALMKRIIACVSEARHETLTGSEFPLEQLLVPRHTPGPGPAHISTVAIV